jgi:hypothetical protein
MVTKEQLHQLAEYDSASWAVWSCRFNKSPCVEDGTGGEILAYIEGRIDELKPNVVLAGLNPPAASERDGIPKRIFGNFHTVKHRGDGLLKETIPMLDNIHGAYMTDLSAAAGDVNINPDKAKKDFEAQLNILAAAGFYVVCWGEKVFNTFREMYSPGSPSGKEFHQDKFEAAVNGRPIAFFGSLHYSYITNRSTKRKDEFIERLKDINKSIHG